MSDQKPKLLTVSKLDAARRQLKTAIQLWFRMADPVSIHTLAYAAHEVIIAIANDRKPGLKTLYDSGIVKEEYRKDFVKWAKGPANFFKHADTDPNSVLEFGPGMADLYILHALYALQYAGEQLLDQESAFMSWTCFHNPTWLTEEGRKIYLDSIPVENLQLVRSIPRTDFLDLFYQARKNLNR